MSVKYLVDDIYIPKDGSKDVINRFCANTESDILVFPDVHLKKNSKMANGTLISSTKNVYLSCLGVENCGFTFGRIVKKNDKDLVDSFKSYSKILGDRNMLPRYSINELQDRFDILLRKDFTKKRYLYDFLGYSSIERVLSDAHRILDGDIIRMASETLCTLGGGNHFFEIHKVIKLFDDIELEKDSFVFMLHSDSIAVGDLIFNLYSDLWEMFMNSPRKLKHRIAVSIFREKQKRYFKRIGFPYSEYKYELNKIFKHGNDYKYIEADSIIGKNLLFVHNICSIFGDMNRFEIIERWSESQNIETEVLGNHSHDNVSVEIHKYERRIVHRNGVQFIGKDKYCILPGAMGSFSYILSNRVNEDAYFSTNHGTGRMYDKHIAREHYSDVQTIRELKDFNIALFRVGDGSLAEQNMHSFKNPNKVLNQMHKYNLASAVAMTRPIAIIKG